MITTQLIAVALLAWAAGRMIYNVLLHPLRGYPGPLLCRATPVPRMYHRLAGRSPFHSHALHKRYGKVVRVSPNELSYIDGDAWKGIYGHGNTALPRDIRATPRARDNEPAMISIDDMEEHRHQRNIFSPAFSNRALKEQEPMLLKHINLLVEGVRRKGAAAGGKGIDIVQWFNFTTFDIMGDLAFGKPLGLLENAEYTPWVRNTFAGIKIFALRSAIIYYIPQLDRLMPFFVSRSLQEKRRAHVKYTSDQVHARLARETDQPDIWTLVLRSYEGQNKNVRLTMGQMKSNASLFMIAGTETTATLLSGAVYLLASHPAKLDRLAREVRGAFGRSEDMTLDALPRLPFLNAVVDESFRLYPPVPDAQFRRTPPGGAVIAGRFVPGGATVFLTQYAAFRSPENFAAPDEFLPERWLPGAGEGFARDERRVLQPFSVGPRGCLGMNLAYHEIRLMLSYLLWHFDLELCKESDDWMDQKVYALWVKKPLMVRVTPVGGR